jgi:glycerol kinase
MIHKNSDSKKIITIDQGTTGSTVLIIDFEDKENPKILGKSTSDFTQYFPKTGWVEHDLEEIWTSIKKAFDGALGQTNLKLTADSFTAIGITNQRETLCVFEKGTGRPLCKAIVWQCKRSLPLCEELKSRGLEPLFREKTGLFIDPYFTGTKLTWLLRENKTVAEALRNGSALVGTVDSWLLYRLTGGKIHGTDASNASRTLMFNIKTGKWDEDLLKLLEVPEHILPKVYDSSHSFGHTQGSDFLPDGILISGILGDQQAALVGQACFGEGEAKCTYGTGAFALTNIGHQPKASNFGLLTTVAWSLKGKMTYALEGSSFIAGAAVQFLRDQLQLVSDAKQTSSLSPAIFASPEIYFVPCLSGLGAPWWDSKAKGAIFGLTRGTTKDQVVRATLEGIGFQVADLMRSMASDLGKQMPSIKVDGGASANDLLMQFQADILGVKVDRPKNIETTAFGAAMFAALGAGIFKDLDDMKTAWVRDRLFESNISEEKRISLEKGWKRAVKAVQYFSEDEK